MWLLWGTGYQRGGHHYLPAQHGHVRSHTGCFMYCHAVGRHDSRQPLGPRGRVVVGSCLQHLKQFGSSVRSGRRFAGGMQLYVICSHPLTNITHKRISIRSSGLSRCATGQANRNRLKKPSCMARMHVDASTSGKAKAHAHFVK